MIDFDIKKAGAENAAAFAHVHAGAFPPAAAWDEAAFLKLLENPATEGFLFYRLDSEAPVGCALLQGVKPQAEILTIAVDADQQRQGLGFALMRHVERAMKAAGFAELFLEVAADNTSAHMLYDKCGFKPFGVRPKYYQRKNGAVDAVLMKKEIS